MELAAGVWVVQECTGILEPSPGHAMVDFFSSAMQYVHDGDREGRWRSDEPGHGAFIYDKCDSRMHTDDSFELVEDSGQRWRFIQCREAGRL